MSDQIVLQNLKRIWSQRKKERGITQVTAAKELGWTQGALSQYLNNLTELSPSAIIKLANYLEVSAETIDPTLKSQMPKYTSLRVRHRDLKTSVVRDATSWLYTAVGDPNMFIIYMDEDVVLKNLDRLLYKNTKMVCSETKHQQQKRQPDSPVTTYSVLTQTNKSQRLLELDRVPYYEWKTIDTSAFLKHYTVLGLSLI